MISIKINDIEHIHEAAREFIEHIGDCRVFAFYGKCAIKQTGYALGSLVQPTKLRVLILTSLNKKNTLSGILLKKGGGGIRTHGTLARSTVFKTAPINRSGTPPKQYLSFCILILFAKYLLSTSLFIYI